MGAGGCPKEIIASIALSRLGKPEDGSKAFLFLASDDASFITGEILDVNGEALMDCLKKDEPWTANHEP